ncbi:MAG: hypothetical protein ABR562_06660 [Thermoplasmatota archaeon]|nr:hypothetical protein [Halobacteriales archaeon]
MRAALLAILVLSMTLAGCGSKDSDGTTSPTGQCLSTEDDGSAACMTTTGTGNPTTTTTTSRAPNVPPVIKVKVTNATAATTNVTFAGGTLTFDASASSDGDGLSAIAMVAKEGNLTFDAKILFAQGKFTRANYTFERAGVVNVTISGIDMRGAVTTVQSHVYVDLKQVLGDTYQFAAAMPDQVAKAETCKGPADKSEVDNLVWTKDAFAVENGTTYVTATIVKNKGEIAICAPDATAVSDASTTTVTSKPGTVFVHPTGADGYFVSVYGNTAQDKVPVEVVVHYEPQA